MRTSILFALLIISSISLLETILDSNLVLNQVIAAKDCEDKAWEKYMEKGDGPYNKYMNRADDVPLPDEEEDVDKYLNELEPLADDYIDELEPYAEEYIEDLGDCLN